jgi:YebC/PmpR family DNA-binding regulatory protein
LWLRSTEKITTLPMTAFYRFFHSTTNLFAGHSKWAKIKRAKGSNDAARGLLFGKLASALSAAVRAGGPDVASNLRLAALLEKSKASGMPKDIINRAISVNSDGVAKEECLYEATLGSVGILIECLTDSRARTMQEFRKLFKNYGAQLAPSGSVAWQFSSLTEVTCEKVDPAAQDQVMELALEGGAQDVTFDEESQSAKIITDSMKTAFEIKKKLDSAGISTSLEFVRVPQAYAELDQENATILQELEGELDDNPDVLAVYHNGSFTTD